MSLKPIHFVLTVTVFALLSPTGLAQGREGEAGGPRVSGEARPDRFGKDRRSYSSSISEQDIKIALKLIRNYKPDRADQLEMLREENPDKFKRDIARYINFLRYRIEQVKRDPEGAELKFQLTQLTRKAYDLGRRIRSNPNDKEERIAELKTVLEKAYDTRLKKHKHDLDRWQMRIKKFRQSIADQRKNRAKVVEKRFNNLLAGRRIFDDSNEKRKDREVGDNPQKRNPPNEIVSVDDNQRKPRANNDKSSRRSSYKSSRSSRRRSAPTAKQIKEAIQFIAREDQKLADHLSKLQKEKPDEFRRIIPRYIRRVEWARRHKKNDPVGFELYRKVKQLEVKAYSLARKIRDGVKENVRLKKELKTILGSHFDAMIKSREHEISKSEKKLKDAASRIKQVDKKAELERQLKFYTERRAHRVRGDRGRDHLGPRDRRPGNDRDSKASRDK